MKFSNGLSWRSSMPFAMWQFQPSSLRFSHDIVGQATDWTRRCCPPSTLHSLVGAVTYDIYTWLRKGVTNTARVKGVLIWNICWTQTREGVKKIMPTSYANAPQVDRLSEWRLFTLPSWRGASHRFPSWSAWRRLQGGRSGKKERCENAQAFLHCRNLKVKSVHPSLPSDGRRSRYVNVT